MQETIKEQVEETKLLDTLDLLANFFNSLKA
jgi:hypothetical protein